MRKVLMTSAFLALTFYGLAEDAAKEETVKPSRVEPVEIAVLGGDMAAIPAKDKKATVLLFLSCDCPIANAFAPEIGRIYEAYKDKGVAFFRVYPDTTQNEADIQQHAADYSHKSPAIHDAAQVLVQRTGARITPEAVVITPEGNIAYRGRINDLFTDIGKRRREATTADLRDALDAVLQGKPVKTPETRAFGCYIPLEFEEQEQDTDAAS